ncbi:MAG: helix-turn-helix transcriptional regulator [Candidatus Shapirobacteria bacterium]
MKHLFELSQKIKKSRILAGFSQKELGAKLNLSDKTISAYELGRAIPPLPTLQKIAQITQRPTEEFLEESSFEDKQAREIKAKLDLILKRVSAIERKIKK